jgi:hypothetical protein
MRFSTKDPVYQGPGQSTPERFTLPGSLAPPLKKVPNGDVKLYIMTGRNITYQKVLFPRLSATVRRPMQKVA